MGRWFRQRNFPSGQKAAQKSIPIVLPKENATLPIIDNYRFKTEVDRDLLGFPRQTRPYNFLTKDDQFELSSEDWIYDVTGLNERPLDDSTQSARWTQLSQTSAVYSPAPNGEVKYNGAANSAQLTLSTNKVDFSEQGLRPSAGIATSRVGLLGRVLRLVFLLQAVL